MSTNNRVLLLVSWNEWNIPCSLAFPLACLSFGNAHPTLQVLSTFGLSPCGTHFLSPLFCISLFFSTPLFFLFSIPLYFSLSHSTSATFHTTEFSLGQEWGFRRGTSDWVMCWFSGVAEGGGGSKSGNREADI